MDNNYELKQVDKFRTWTKEMKIKPSKCHCLCCENEILNISYDPGLTIGGKSIRSIPSGVIRENGAAVSAYVFRVVYCH